MRGVCSGAAWFIGPGDTLRDLFSPPSPRLAPALVLHRSRRPPARARTWRGLLALGLLLAGCGDASSSDAPHSPPRVEVGTGREFTVLEEGATLELVRGSQGSQHVFVSLRAWELSPLTAQVELSLARTEDGRAVSAPYKLRLPFEPGSGAEAPATLESLLLVVTDPELAVDREVRLTATVQSESGARATDARTVTLQWCTTMCP